MAYESVHKGIVNYWMECSISRCRKGLNGISCLSPKFIAHSFVRQKKRDDGVQSLDFFPHAGNIPLFFAQNDVWVFHGIIVKGQHTITVAQ